MSSFSAMHRAHIYIYIYIRERFNIDKFLVKSDLLYQCTYWLTELVQGRLSEDDVMECDNAVMKTSIEGITSYGERYTYCICNSEYLHNCVLTERLYTVVLGSSYWNV